MRGINIFLKIEIFCAPKDSADSSRYLLICISTALHALKAYGNLLTAKMITIINHHDANGVLSHGKLIE